MTQSSDLALLLAAVALPPPLHGQSAINSEMIGHLAAQEKLRVVAIDVGPREYGSKCGYHINRIFGVLRAVAKEFRHANRPKRTVYTVIESGWGRFYNLAVLAFARLLRFQIILHHHTSAHTLNRSSFFEFIARLAGRDAMHVVLGQAMARDLRNGYPLVSQVLVVHNSSFLSLPEDVSKVGLNLPRLTIGFLSNLTNEKGLGRVFDVLRFGRAEGLELELKLAGPATNEKIAAQIRSAQLEFGRALTVLGPVGPSEKRKFFASIDVFLFLSRYKFEAQPLVVLEAMSFGVPTIVSQCGYTSEIVGDTGHVILDQSAATAESVSVCRQYVDGTTSLAAMGSKSRSQFMALKKEGHLNLQLLQNWIIEGTRAT